MYGEAGNDTFVIVAGGTDMIVGGANTDALSFASFTSGISLDLSARSTSFGALGSITFSEVEDVVGTGHADTLTGDAAANRLDGGAGTDSLLGGLGNDVLIGGLGADMLNGGLGLDVFLFDAALNARTNVDAIKGFNVADDLIQLENAIFTRLPGIGTLEAEAFHVGFAAHDASDRIIYNSATGALFYDADGNGFGAAVQFASLSAALGLTHADFVIV
jgi:serralysin